MTVKALHSLEGGFKMKKIILGSIIIAICLLFVQRAFSHCEIPCGIYEDEMRFDMIKEHIDTIEKAMNMILDLSKAKDKNYNQLMRWIVNKEQHAKEIQFIVYQYFMTQRVTPVDEKDAEKYEKYLKKITLLHQMLVYAMKAKQTTDLGNVEKLRSLLDSFATAYLGPDA